MILEKQHNGAFESFKTTAGIYTAEMKIGSRMSMDSNNMH
jgi:hypothetical protein